MKPTPEEVKRVQDGIAAISIGDPANPHIRKVMTLLHKFAPDFLSLDNPDSICRFTLCTAIGATIPFPIVIEPNMMEKVDTETRLADLLVSLCPRVAIQTDNLTDEGSSNGKFMITEKLEDPESWDLKLATTRELIRFASLLNKDAITLPKGFENGVIRGQHNELHIKNGSVTWVHVAKVTIPEDTVVMQLVKLKA